MSFSIYYAVILIIGFVLSLTLIHAFMRVLPRDQGRAFAINGMLSQGKPRGAGLVFTAIFVVLCLITVIFDPDDGANPSIFSAATPLQVANFTQTCIYMSMILASSLFGYLDDRSNRPWNEYLKGVIDLLLSVVCAVTYVHYNGTTVHLFSTSTVDLHPVVFVICASALIWISINVTNCSDGVDGLCGMVSVSSLLAYATILLSMRSPLKSFAPIMVAVLLGYLWWNASPSKVLMGDAGSRAIGALLAILALMTKAPLVFIPLSLIFIVDGGIGLVKVALLRFFKVKIFTKVRFPLHDHLRKTLGWTDSQAVLRFFVIQTVLSLICIALVAIGV